MTSYLGGVTSTKTSLAGTAAATSKPNGAAVATAGMGVAGLLGLAAYVLV